VRNGRTMAGGEGDVKVGEGAAAAADHMDVKYKVPAPVFSGDGVSKAAISREFHQFVRKFEQYATTIGLQGEQLVAAAALCFKKDSSADRWFYNLARMEDVEEWDDLKGRMEVRFAEEWNPATLLQERAKLVQKPTESVDQFCDRIEDFQIVMDDARRKKGYGNAVIRQLHGDDVYVSLLSGMKEPLKSNLLRRDNLNSLEELLKAARLEESVEKTSGRSLNFIGDDDNDVAAIGGGGGGSGPSGGGNARGNWLFTKPSKRPKWVTLRFIPKDHCAVCAKKGHKGWECNTPLEQQQWDQIIDQIRKNANAAKNKGGGGGGNNKQGGGGQGGRGGGGSSMNLLQSAGIGPDGRELFTLVNQQPAGATSGTGSAGTGAQQQQASSASGGTGSAATISGTQTKNWASLSSFSDF